MKGKIAYANQQHGRYAVLTDDGDYTLFELPPSADVAVGVPVPMSLILPRAAICARRTEK